MRDMDRDREEGERTANRADVFDEERIFRDIGDDFSPEMLNTSQINAVTAKNDPQSNGMRNDPKNNGMNMRNDPQNNGMRNDFQNNGMNTSGEQFNAERLCAVRERFREIWEEHVWWTRNTIISTVNKLPDLKYATDRLLQNPADMAAMFRGFGSSVEKQIKELFTEHIVTFGGIVSALTDGNTAEAERLEKILFKNADKIAAALHSLNPAVYSEEEWRKMMYEHLNLTKEEAVSRLKGDYRREVEAFDKVEKEARQMADMMSLGV
jgi:hypothetical protein